MGIVILKELKLSNLFLINYKAKIIQKFKKYKIKPPIDNSNPHNT